MIGDTPAGTRAPIEGRLPLIDVILTYPNGQQQQVTLAGVPRVGDHIRITENLLSAPSLIVDMVLWMEAGEGRAYPTVVCVVRQNTEQEGRP